MIIKIILAILFGLAIGIERELHGKAIGIKTTPLIILGSLLFCGLSSNVINGDNTRVIAAIVQGVGFLGAGVIFKNGDETKGLTTAATIWVAAAIGCLISFGFYFYAFLSTCIVILINSLFNLFKKNHEKFSQKPTRTHLL